MNKTLQLPGKNLKFASASPSDSLFNERAVDMMIQALIQAPDFDEVLRRAGLARFELRKMEGDDEITAATDTRREAVIATNWHLESGDGKPAEGPNADFILEEITPHLETMSRAAWSAVPYGYSVFETVYKRLDGNRIGLDFVSEKPFEWFQPLQGGGLKYRPVTDPQGIEVDTVYKFFCTVRQPTYRLPYGK